MWKALVCTGLKRRGERGESTEEGGKDTGDVVNDGNTKKMEGRGIRRM